MICTEIVDNYYNDIAKNYIKYIGQRLEVVILDLSKNHIVKPYKLCDLQNNDVVVWRSRKDNMAHVTIYNKNRFFYSSPKGIKMHQVLLNYKKMLLPKYIIRLGVI